MLFGIIMYFFFTKSNVPVTVILSQSSKVSKSVKTYNHTKRNKVQLTDGRYIR